MERRARYILVALFLLITIGAMTWFMRWISPTDRGAMEERLIQFDSSVSGLSVGSEARYLGVPVGRVTAIGLNDKRYGRVDVRVGLDEVLPPSSELVALLEPQGITGLALIELRDREEVRVSVEVEEGVIPGQPSVFSQVSDSAVRVAESTEAALERINALLDEQTVEDFAETVRSLRTLSGNLAGASGEIDQLLDSLVRISSELETTVPSYRSLAQRLEAQVIPTVVQTGQSLQATSDTVARTLGDNRDEIEELLQQDLPTLIGLTDELATTLQELQQLMENINNQPGALIYGASVKEVDIPLE